MSISRSPFQLNVSLEIVQFPLKTIRTPLENHVLAVPVVQVVVVAVAVVAGLAALDLLSRAGGVPRGSSRTLGDPPQKVGEVELETVIRRK